MKEELPWYSDAISWLLAALKDQSEEILAALVVAAILAIFTVFKRLAKRSGGGQAGGHLPSDPLDKLPGGGESPHERELTLRPQPTPRSKYVDIPAPTPNYTGRAQKLAEITAALNSGYSSAIVGVGGMGGVGKTETAQVIAHRLLKSGRYPDGATMIDLQGFSESGAPPLSATAALTTLLTRRGVSVPAPPDGDQTAFADALAAKWREVTTDRDMLVILDNARDGEQVRPLLPGKGATALITSRHSIHLPQVQEVTLEKLDDPDARELIEALCPDLAEADIETFLRIADGLPLLIETAAPFLNDADGRSVTAKLADYEAAGGDQDALGKLLARLDLSIAALSADDASHYAALSQFDRGFHAQWAATLWGVDQDEAEKRLAKFHRRNLIMQADSTLTGTIGARWRLHDHMQAAAAARLQDDPHATTWRHGWMKAGAEIMEIAGGLYSSHGEGITAGLALLDQELATIRTVADAAGRDAANDDVAANVAMRLPNYDILDLRLPPQQRLKWLLAGIPGAERLDHKQGQATLIGNAAHRYYSMGDLDQAEDMYRKSLALEEALDRKEGMAADYGNLGNLYRKRGDLDQAEEMYRKSLKLHQTMGQKEGMARDYGNLGVLYRKRGDLDQAEEMYRKSLELNEAMDRKEGMARQFGNLANLYRLRGDLDQAEEMYLKSLELNKTMGRKEGMANQYFNLAALRLDQSRAADALPYAEKAQAIFAELGMKPDVKDADDLIAEIKGHLPE